MRVGLRVCVNTLEGALKGIPNLLRLFDSYKIRASFFFAVGPDRSGRSLGKGSMQPWRGNRSLLSRARDYLKPPPDITRLAAHAMRSVAEQGHETGLLGFDRSAWIKQSPFADAAWTEASLRRAVDAYADIFKSQPKCYAAAGWQVNPGLFSLEQQLGFDYATDTRGKTLFYPVLQGVESKCVQIPTTLPALTEMLSAEDVTVDNVHEYIFAQSQYILPHGHVYSLDAEMEGMHYLPLMEKLIVMWNRLGEGVGRVGEALDLVVDRPCDYYQVGWQAEEGSGLYQARQSVLVRNP